VIIIDLAGKAPEFGHSGAITLPSVDLPHQALKTRQMMNGRYGRGGKQDDDEDLDDFVQLGPPLLKDECLTNG
jgi:hypothetical protein